MSPRKWKQRAPKGAPDHFAPRTRLLSSVPWLVAISVVIGFGVLTSGTWWLKAQGGAGVESRVADAAEQEIARRQRDIGEGETLIREGDLLLSEGELSGAVAQYRAAVLKLRDYPMFADYRKLALAKYERAAVEEADKLIEGAEFEEAGAVLKALLEPEVGSQSEVARRMLVNLAREDYHNEALTPEHVAKVAKVEDLLRRANALVGMGEFDEASLHYAQVLAYDSYNVAARMGLERIDRLAAEYAGSAYDQTRGKAVADLMEQWATVVPTETVASLGEPGEMPGPGRKAGDLSHNLRVKMDTIVFPSVEFSDTSLRDVMEFLTARSAELDTMEPNPAKRGLGLIVKAPDEAVANSRITLKLSNVPLSEILRYVTQQAGLKVRVEPYAVSLVPLSDVSETLVTRSYRVPPTFLVGGSMEAKADVIDPFAPAGEEDSSALAPKLTARQFLENNGVVFPPGSMAQFIPATSTLLVRNTLSNVELIEAIVDASQVEVPLQVLVKVRVMDVLERQLNEIGFDWLLDQFNIPGSDRVFGAGGTFGATTPSTQVGDLPSDFPFVAPGSTLPLGRFPVTYGNRSGDAGLGGDPLEELIGNPTRTATRSRRAPGVLSVGGAFTDPEFQVVMRALSQQKGVDILSVPSTVVRSGQLAQIKSVREFIYPTEYDPPELPSGGFVAGADDDAGDADVDLPLVSETTPATPSTPTNFETREVGNILDVEPIIGPDKFTVDLNLTPEISEFLGFINYGTPITTAFGGGPPREVTPNTILMPVFQIIKESTSVQVWDGQTVVIGGLLESTRTGREDKTPIFGSLPVVGRFFQNRAKEVDMRAIVIFVSVRIIDPAGRPVNDLSVGGR